MQLEAIQSALRDAGLDGWLFCDHHKRDALAYRVLGLDAGGQATRRWFYFVPATGEPVKLTSRVEPHRLDALPGRGRNYLAWTELHAEIRAMLAGRARIAMQYSPLNHIPYVALVDAGTIELVRSAGTEVVSSADLIQRFEAVSGEEGLASHRAAGEIVQRVKDEAFAAMDRALRDRKRLTEHDLAELILARFTEAGLTSDGASPIVGFNDHAADPHFEPTAENAHVLKEGDTILVDLWAHIAEPPGVYYDITWCGFAGTAPPPQYQEIFDVVLRARDRALELVRTRFEAGQPCQGCEVDRAAREVIERAGYGDAFLHRTGHSIGLEVHGAGANIDDLETRDERQLVPGTCFSIEPGIYLAGRMGVRSEIDVFLTPGGSVEVFGAVQRELVRVGAG